MLTRQLCDIGLTAIAFESVVDRSGARPLLAPMSRIAGRLAVLGGGAYLFRNNGGKGILLGGIDSADRGRVVVIGAGVAGAEAAETASSIGAGVTVFDLQQHRLREIESHCKNCTGILSEPQRIADEVRQADLVVSAVMVAGRRAPVVITEDMVRAMEPGSVIVDIAIDQGGSVEHIQPTSYAQPVYKRHGVLHEAVPNIPGAVPRTASQALSSAVLPYVVELLERGVDEAGLSAATAVRGGQVVDPVLKQELGL